MCVFHDVCSSSFTIHFIQTVRKPASGSGDMREVRDARPLQVSASNTSITAAAGRTDAALEPIVDSIIDHLVPLLQQQMANPATAQVRECVRLNM
jgi:hypothetical protein